MPSERRRLVEDLFDRAIDLPPAERGRFLAEACGGDEALRAEVLRLVAAHERAEGILDAPREEVDALVEEIRERSAAPERLGPYRLLEEIGRGGMGTVHLAERDDGQFRQRVAVKLIRPGLPTDEIVRRFLAERQILASLQHPNIGRLLDGGVAPDGRPYLVMEHVEGEPLDAYCDRRCLPVEERVRLFCAVARAVHHAHRNLVVHRDLKPSNILVTPEGEPKLLDFGIAKLLGEEPEGGEAPLTRPGFRPMTPEYASPEQVRGAPITTATDVYGLGLVLFELLSGRRPFEAGRERGEIERRILRAEPPRLGTAATGGRGIARTAPTPETRRVAERRRTSPRRLARKLGGDLDRIVAVALRKEPERRYPSAEALAADLERWLLGRPVAARGDGPGYRARRLVSRHPWGAAAVAAFALVLAGYAATVTVQSRAIRAALERAESERARSERLTSFLMALFEAGDPAEAQGDTLTASELLERGVARAELLRDDPLGQAQMLDAIGRVYTHLGRYDRAEPLLRRALALREREVAAPGGDLAASLHALGDLLRLRGEYAEAETVFRGALERSRATFGPQSAEAAGELSSLAILLGDRGDFAAAEPLHREALALRRARLGPEHEAVAESLAGLGFVALELGRLDEAERHYRQALEMRLRLLGDSHPDVAGTRSNLASVLTRRGDHAEAERLHREVLATRLRLFGPEHPSVAITLNNLAHTRFLQGDHVEADSLLRRVVEMRVRLLGEEHPAVATALNNLAFVHFRSGDPATAEPLFRRVIDLQRRTLGTDHPNTAGALHNLALLLRETGEREEAERLLRESLAIRQRIFPPDHPDVERTRRDLEELLAGR